MSIRIPRLVFGLLADRYGRRIPLIGFPLRHPGALSARYATTTYLSSDISAGEIARSRLKGALLLGKVEVHCADLCRSSDR